MIMINSNCTLPIDKIIEVCKIAYDNLNDKRNQKVDVWFNNQKQKHLQQHNKRFFKAPYTDPTDEELFKAATDTERDNLNYCKNFHREDGIIICTIHESARFAKQLGADSMQVDTNSLYAIYYWYNKLADKQ